jgi:DHA2 family multidrug resistance protein
MSAAIPAYERADLKTWVGIGGAILGAFMAIVNIQITNAALLDIEGGIGTGGANGAWISTAYLVGEIIVIPLCDYLSRVFSMRRFLLVNTALFLMFSVACAFAGSLEQMIVLRGLQGFTGGVLIPVAFTLVATTLPMNQRPLGMAGFSLAATFAPAIGPTIGGWLSDNYGWEFIFYVNLVPGLVMLAALSWSLKPAPMQLKLLKTGDWTGIAALAIGLGALQTVLEEGNIHDWFGSQFIVNLAIVAVVFLGAFLWIELHKENPVVNLRLLKRRNFGVGTLSNFLFGFGLYGAGFVLAQYLAHTQGYNAEQIGKVVMWTGLPQLLIVPFVPFLIKRFNVRWLAATGLALFAVSNLWNVQLSALTGGDQLLVPNVIRAVGMALVMTPLSALAMSDITREEAGAASGLYNMMRNLGGAFGTAILVTFLTKREQFHSNVINAHVQMTDPATVQRVESLKQYFLSHGVSDAAAATRQAFIAIGKTIHHQAELMGFADTFGLLGAVVLLGAVSVLFMRNMQTANAGGGAAH